MNIRSPEIEKLLAEQNTLLKESNAIEEERNELLEESNTHAATQNFLLDKILQALAPPVSKPGVVAKFIGTAGKPY